MLKRLPSILISVIASFVILSACQSPSGGDPAVPVTYALSLSDDGHGSVGASPSGARLEAGTEVTVSSTPTASSVFKAWTDAEGTVVSTSNPYSFKLEKDTALVATHSAASAAQHGIAVSAPHGTVTLSPSKEWYDEGDVVNVSVSDAAGYRFTGWTGALSGAGRNRTLTVGASDISIGASFVERWVVLVHMAVDNNIDYAFENDDGILTNYLSALEAVEAADANDVLDIMVLMDSYDLSDPRGEGYTTTFTDGYYKLHGGAFSSETPVATGEIDSGAVAVTKAFADWAFANSNGRRVLYSVFNHGSGFDDASTAGTYGIGFDDSADDCLTHYELQQTTAYIKATAGRNIEVFFPYACLMGGVELAWEVRRNANVLLCSEETYPAEKWSYEALGSIVSNPAISAPDLAKAFCDNADAFFSSPAGDRSFTLSAIDLSRMQGLYDALDAFARAASSWIGGNASRAKSMDAAASTSLIFYTPYYVDLGTFMDQVDARVGGFSARTAAVRSALDGAVIYKKARTASRDRDGESVVDYDDASGLSIYHNLWMLQRTKSSGADYPPSIYRSILTFGAANYWAQYAQGMYNLCPSSATLAKDLYESDGSSSSVSRTLVAGAANAQTHTFNDGTGSNDLDYMRVHLESGKSYTFQTGMATTPGFPAIVLYNPSVSSMLAYSALASVENKFSYTPTSTGDYVLLVVDNYNLQGDYTVFFDEGTWAPPRGVAPSKVLGDPVIPRYFPSAAE